jgi:nitrogen regulatory protein P-II 1
MKKIEANIQHQHVDAVVETLKSMGLWGMTIAEVREYGGDDCSSYTYRGVTAKQPFQPRTQIEVIVADEDADLVIDAIFQIARQGEVGDGRILVTSLESVMRIRTGKDEAEKATSASSENTENTLQPENRIAAPLNSANWFGARTLHETGASATDYWASHNGS